MDWVSDHFVPGDIMRTSPVLVLTAAAAALVLGACGSSATEEPAGSGTAVSSSGAAAPSGTVSPSGAATPAAGDAMAAGAYLTKKEYENQMAAREGTTIVYFFHAPWCPDCRATEEAIEADGIPAGLTVVKVDFDTETDLRREYGVTQQHTFVQVGPDGEQLATWTGSRDGAEIKAETV
jgi:thioredoxin 1